VLKLAPTLRELPPHTHTGPGQVTTTLSRLVSPVKYTPIQRGYRFRCLRTFARAKDRRSDTVSSSDFHILLVTY
jgi:hypothetical protein